MSLNRLDSAVPGRAIAIALVASAAMVSIAWCTEAQGVPPAATHEHSCAGGARSAACVSARQAGATDGWSALSGIVAGQAPSAAYDPSTLIGPPVPAALLYSPSNSPFQAGMTIQLESNPAAGAHGAGMVPTASSGQRLTLLSDVADRLVPVRMPNGMVKIDLTDIYVSTFTAKLTPRGVAFGHDEAPGTALEVK